jgi:phosphate starvation-inducible protein PhoH and related proteins
MTRKSKKLSKEDEEDIVHSMQDKEVKNPLHAHIELKCKTENQKKFIGLINDKEIVVATGFAGTGKTFLSCAKALLLLKGNPKFRKIMLIKSVTELKGESLGYLKGSVEDKMSPYMESFKDNFRKLIGKPAADALEQMGMIEVQPLAFIRGRTIDNTIMIVDESQNISFDNMKTILTRIGENSKIIIIGDTKQIDLKNKYDSSLFQVVDKFAQNPLFGVMQFEKSDQVRNPIINVIEEIFDGIEDENKANKKSRN